MERIAMSQEERDWLDWLKRVRNGHVTQRMAAEKMGVTDRWVRALLAEMPVKGDAVVVHGLRGRRSNRRIAEEVRSRAMEIVKSPEWHDFRPTFACEQLAKRHQIEVSKETGSPDTGKLSARPAGRPGDFFIVDGGFATIPSTPPCSATANTGRPVCVF